MSLNLDICARCEHCSPSKQNSREVVELLCHLAVPSESCITMAEIPMDDVIEYKDETTEKDKSLTYVRKLTCDPRKLNRKPWMHFIIPQKCPYILEHVVTDTDTSHDTKN